VYDNEYTQRPSLTGRPFCCECLVLKKVDYKINKDGRVQDYDQGVEASKNLQ
jgi:hypothetical protein